jgi:hypothetical protein
MMKTYRTRTLATAIAMADYGPTWASRVAVLARLDGFVILPLCPL